MGRYGQQATSCTCAMLKFFSRPTYHPPGSATAASCASFTAGVSSPLSDMAHALSVLPQQPATLRPRGKWVAAGNCLQGRLRDRLRKSSCSGVRLTRTTCVGSHGANWIQHGFLFSDFVLETMDPDRNEERGGGGNPEGEKLVARRKISARFGDDSAGCIRPLRPGKPSLRDAMQCFSPLDADSIDYKGWRERRGG